MNGPGSVPGRERPTRRVSTMARKRSGKRRRDDVYGYVSVGHIRHACEVSGWDCVYEVVRDHDARM